MKVRYDAGEVITAMITPFKEDFSVDFKSLENLVHHLITNGTDMILVNGTTGESPTLTHEEELDILKCVRSAAGSKIKIMMGAGSNSTHTAVEVVERTEQIGADAILSVVPYYNKPNQKGIFEHFSAIAKATTLPVMLYNIPGRTGVMMNPTTIADLARAHKNIFAVKQSAPDIDLVTEIAYDTPEDFTIYSGDDSMTLPILAVGGMGVVSVASHLVGAEIKNMIAAFKAGNNQLAKEIHFKNYDFFAGIFTHPNPIPIKALLKDEKIIACDEVRPPLFKLTQDEISKLKIAISDGVVS
ncbi:MAG: 4-hydroxy-tetrahydrodipicolinate synthase [Chitinispirillales bacterium]|jgi:4-hydroxy-tetrahydrodipicolinate synthase|nr:4-hydroxy-tetrahydrodipicolinate synthase [Chitinispirillales bacterium]